MLFGVVFNMVRARVIAEANFDPETVSPISVVGEC